MTKIRKSLMQFIFSGSHMRRWNDKLRSVELYEIDKQAHKMIIAFFLYRLECKKLSYEESLKLGQELIEGALFDYFYRLVITDIKPPVYYRIRENEEDYKALTDWVLAEMEPIIRPCSEEFWLRLVDYHRNPVNVYDENSPLASRILNASHLYASKWEFSLIRPLNFFDEELRDIESSFMEQLSAMQDLEGVRMLLASANNPMLKVVNLCGQLRFQIRWSQVPRIPETSVLGHMFVVACLAYFVSIDLDVCTARRNNNFFAGLFHDIPELLTRDIINPVKNAVERMPDIIQKYEDDEIQRRVLEPLRNAGYDDIVDRLVYYLGLHNSSCFKETIRDEHGVVHIMSSFEELHEDCNKDILDAKDGELIKACDNLAAFLEARASLQHGISSPALHEACARITKKYKYTSFASLQMSTLLADFD